MKVDGACLCGKITYEAEVNPAKVAICHCTQCQISSASVYRFGALVRAEDFKLLSGTLKEYVKTAESGNQRVLTFCPDCGTSLYGTGLTDRSVLSLRLGTARQRAELAPTSAVWCRSALPWLPAMPNVREYDMQTGPARPASPPQ